MWPPILTGRPMSCSKIIAKDISSTDIYVHITTKCTSVIIDGESSVDCLMSDDQLRRFDTYYDARVTDGRTDRSTQHVLRYVHASRGQNSSPPRFYKALCAHREHLCVQLASTAAILYWFLTVAASTVLQSWLCSGRQGHQLATATWDRSPRQAADMDTVGKW